MQGVVIGGGLENEEIVVDHINIAAVELENNGAENENQTDGLGPGALVLH